MTCFIIDDEWHAISDLADLAVRSKLTVLGACTDPMEGLAKVRELKPDLLFCDVEMTRIDGFTLAKSLEEERHETMVVMVTGYYDNTKTALREGLPMLLKPLRDDDFVRTVARCAKRKKEQAQLQTISCRQPKILKIPKLNEKGFVLKSTAEIVYIEIDDNTMKFYFKGQEKVPFETYNSRNKQRSYLAECGFVRIHRSYIINVNFLDKFVLGKVWVKGRDEELPLGRTYRKYFMELLIKFSG